MGAILSLYLATKESIKKSRSKKKTKKQSAAVAPPATSNAQPFAPPSQTQAVEGPQDDHPAFVPPPIAAGQTERNIAVEAPLPVSTITSPTPPTPETKSRSVESGKMASDEDYASFLDKANEDPNQGAAETQGKIKLKAVDGGVRVPVALREVTREAFYVSDADEAFEPVVLKCNGEGLPDEETFAKLVGHPKPGDADVGILDIGEWDPQGQYRELVEAVRRETKGSDVRVYRIAGEGARVEYFVVGVEGGKLVGVKALAIES